MSAKSYWSGVSCRGENSQHAVRSWFSPLGDGMKVESADILCDIETDKEKKIRAVMVDDEGKKWKLTRTIGDRVTISRKAVT